MANSEVRSVCPYCGVGCGIVMSVADGKVGKISGDKQHPSNFGRLCTKGLTAHLPLSASGRMADAYPHLCLRDFDAVVIGDPEDTVPRIYADARAGRLQRLYRSGGYQPDRVPVPRCDLTATQQPAPFGLEVTRGCPFTCDFCALTGSGTRFLTRPVEGVVRDIRAIEASLRGKVPFWRRQMLMFYDNNLAGSFAYLKALCEALAPLGLRCGALYSAKLMPAWLLRMTQLHWSSSQPWSTSYS